MRVAAHNLATERGTALRLQRGTSRARAFGPVQEFTHNRDDVCYRRVVTPRYVQACQNGDWCLNLVSRKDATMRTVPYRCRSWRCQAKWKDANGNETTCQRWQAAQNYARIREALAPFPADEIAFCVFTYRAPPGGNPQSAFEQLRIGWPLLRKRLHRMFGDFDFVSTVEVTRRGWPHLNLIVAGGSMGKLCTVPVERPYTDKDGNQRTRTVYTLGPEARAKLEHHLQDVGMGYVCTVERATSADCISGYAVKVAGEWNKTDGEGTTAGEVIKLSQVPVNAPKGFHRIRASHDFLPSKHTSKGEFTGWLARRDNGMPVATGPAPVAFPDFVRDVPAFAHAPAVVYRLRTARVGDHVNKHTGPHRARNQCNPEPDFITHRTESCSSVSKPTCAGSSVSYTLPNTSPGVAATKAVNAAITASSPWVWEAKNAASSLLSGSSLCWSADSDVTSSATMIAAPRVLAGAGWAGVNAGAGGNCRDGPAVCMEPVCTGPPPPPMLA